MRTVKKNPGPAVVIGCLLLLPLYLLGVGAIVAFLWNEIIVTALHLTPYTLNLWTGTGLVILLNILLGGLRSYSNRN